MSEYAFKFHELRLGERRVLRPMLSVRLTGPKRSLDTVMIVDSGADCSMIQLELAEQLGLAFGGVETTGGISQTIPVYRAEVDIAIKSGGDLLPSLRLPIQIPTERGRPPVAILGREVFFHEYDISFRMGYTPTKGKFILKPVEHRRKAGRYR